MELSNQNEKIKIGALWEKQNEYGTYMTGVLEFGDQSISIFVGQPKERKHDRMPHWNIFTSDDLEAVGLRPPEIPDSGTPQPNNANPITEITLDDIPF